MWNKLVFFLFIGKANLRFKKEEPRIGKIQICFGLQDKGIKEANRTT